MKLWTTLLACLWAGVLCGQTPEPAELALAREYARNGEFEKVRATLQKASRGKDTAPLVHKLYVQALMTLKDYEEAERFLKRQVRADEPNPFYALDYARLAERQGNFKEAERLTTEAIGKAAVSPVLTAGLAAKLLEANQPDVALKLYQAARERSPSPMAFAYELARLHGMMGQTEAQWEELLQFGRQPEQVFIAQAYLQDALKDEKQLQEFERFLLRKIQQNPTDGYLTETLVWHYVQLKEFNRAFVQARALDKRLRQNGEKVTELGFMAMQNRDYAAAGKIFDYLAREYIASPDYPIYRRLLINAKEEVVKTTYPVQTDDIRVLIAQYNALLSELGQNARTLDAMRSTALLYGFYLDEKDSAVALLEKAVSLAGRNQEFTNKSKLDLGDIYVLRNEPWEATLLYSQVEKSARETPIGYEAKLRNARLSYYKADFELARETLNVLKNATSREIANDALSLSLLIQDNTGMDSTETAMKAYAAVELLLFQHKTETALSRLNQLYETYRQHPLADELLWLRANTLLKENRPQEAVADLEKLLDHYAQDILGDDATFLLATVFQEKLKQPDRAMALYQHLLTTYPGSSYVAEARKRFRLLRGDAVN